MSRELPSVFDGESVIAIKAGRKTQMRRVMDVQPNSMHDGEPYWNVGGYRAWQHRPQNKNILRKGGESIKPKYKVGDLLWVKETWRIVGWEPEDMSIAVEFKADNSWIDCIVIEDHWKVDRYAKQCCDEAKKAGLKIGKDGRYEWEVAPPTRYRSPVTMPKVTARLWLRVTDVRAEQLQDIVEDDARMEGVSDPWNYQPPEYYEDVSVRHLDYYAAAFAGRWDRLNAKRGYTWQDNPWVWVYEFKVERVEK